MNHEGIDFMQRKMLDFFKASNQEATDVILSDVFPEIVKQYGESVVGEILAGLLGEIVGAVFPRLNGIRLSYKQNRLESNVCYLFGVLMNYQTMLEDRLRILESKEDTKDFLRFSTELLLDNIVDEIQQSKVSYSVNGYVNLLHTDDANPDMALMFFRTLAQLSDLDIRVLRVFDYSEATETVYDVMEETGIDNEQYRFVKEKLERFGVLQSKNQQLADENQELIVKYLQLLDKDSRSSRPKGVKLPRFNRISRTDSHKITSLGRQYLRLIADVEVR